jgi:putative ABC transport system permease protein
MSEVIVASIAKERFLLLLMSIFSGLALTLTCIGIFPVLSYQVSQRTHEIGIRVALGAQRGDVVGMIMRHGLLLAGAGLALGYAGAFSATRLIEKPLFDIRSQDPATYASVGLLLFAVAAVACWLPASRHTRGSDGGAAT